MNEQLISIVLPVHNQGDHIENIINNYLSVLSKIPQKYEIITVTNACSDNSVAVCNELSEIHSNVKTIDLTKGGWGYAIREGLATAEGDLLCYTNSARTTPQILSLLLVYATAYPGVVVKADRKLKENLSRRVGSLLYNLQCRALFDLATWDINGTPKVFPRKFKKLLNLTRNDDLIDLEFNIICRREGYPLIEVPTLSIQRHGGRSTTNYRSAFNMYKGAFDIYKEIKRVNGNFPISN